MAIIFLSVVVEAALHDDERIILNPIDQSMICCNAAGPPAFQICPKRFRFSNSCKRTSHRITDQLVDLDERLRILFLKEKVIFPTTR